MHPRLRSATLSQLAFPGEGNPNFLWEKSHWDNIVVKKRETIILFTFYNCIVPMGFIPWEIRVAFPGESQLQQSRATQPRVFQYFHNPPNSDMDYGIFNVRTDVNACDCIRGCTDTVRESALKVDSGRKIPSSHRGIEPTLATCRSDALPTELHPQPRVRGGKGLHSHFSYQ